MKKIIFVALSVFGVSGVVSAQEAAEANALAPKKARIERSAGPAGKTTDADLKERQVKAENPAAVQQPSAVDKINQDFESRKVVIRNNDQLTPQQKKDAFDAIDAEKNASLRKTLGTEKYNKYSAEQKSKTKDGKPAKQ